MELSRAVGIHREPEKACNPRSRSRSFNREERATMTRKLVYGFCIIVVCLATVATVSCTKLQTGTDRLVGPLAFKPAGGANAISDEYGTLVGVTQSSPESSVLWFQK